MSFEVDRYSSAWAHIALCADLTWATEPPDEFIIANQRLWAQHCRVTQVLQDAALESQNVLTNNQCELTDKRQITCQIQENGSSSSRRSVKDVIPESRLAQYYGNFYYDEVREKCYTSPNEKVNGRWYNGQGCENSDLTECWMLPEVEYWFRKLVDDTDRSVLPRRRRQYRMLMEEDFERWGPARAAGEEAALAARVRGVRSLWHRTRSPATSPTRALSPGPRALSPGPSTHSSTRAYSPSLRSPRAPSPPPAPRKMRARRRQPRRLAALAPPPPAYYLEAPAQLFCDPTCKFDAPRAPLSDCQRAMGRLSASVQAVMRASAARCLPYRGTNVSRYAPTSQRPARGPERRYGVWWPRDHPSPRLDRFHLHPPVKPKEAETKEASETESQESSMAQKEKVVVDGQMPSTSAVVDAGRKKRLYSTVLSMSAPPPMNLGCVRLSQKLVTPGILKLNPKIVLPAARIRPNVDNKFEELEKEALEQYKASDESIDSKFRELEKQAVEQYSSNSNTSCSSGQSPPSPPTPPAPDDKPAKFHRDAVDSVVIYSQNFPDLNAKQSSVMSLKNFHTPPRGEKKEAHRASKARAKAEQRAASDTDYEARDCGKGCHKGPVRWTLHVAAPKKRHLTCVSDFSSDEEMEHAGAMKDGPCIKNHTGKAKLSAHGGGDLHPIMRKT